MSEQREELVNSKENPENTVFENPDKFWLCMTDDKKSPEMAISRYQRIT